MFNPKDCWTEGKVPLLLNIWEAFLESKRVNPDVQIGFSKFCEAQPKYVVNINSGDMHKVCVCEYHQNVKLMLLSLPVKTNYKDIICKLVCNIDACYTFSYMLYNFIIKNYLFIIEDAVQGFHWENSQLSLHPFVVYYRNTNGNLEVIVYVLFQIIKNIISQLFIAF